MVSVRQSQSQFNREATQGQWLSSLTVEEEKREALKRADDWLLQQENVGEHGVRKGRDMVEILSELNMDLESLLTALLYPAYDQEQLKTDAISH